MGERRKLQGEVDRVLKRVADGVETFEDIWDKVQNSSNNNQKEKHEQELKKEIKKLQRLRDQIKSWLTSSDIKDKTVLIEARRKIENLMERFKVVERETKTKAYSKEGLGASQKLDPQKKEKENAIQWLTQGIEALKLQTDTTEAESESVMATSKKKKDEKERLAKLDLLKQRIDRNTNHISSLEKVLRLVDNDALNMKRVNDLKDDMDYYIESNQDPDFRDNEDMYNDICLEDTSVVVWPEDRILGRSSECDDNAKPFVPTTTFSSVNSLTGKGVLSRQKNRIGSHNSGSIGSGLPRSSYSEGRHLSESNCVFDYKSNSVPSDPSADLSISMNFTFNGSLENKAKSSDNLSESIHYHRHLSLNTDNTSKSFKNLPVSYYDLNFQKEFHDDSHEILSSSMLTPEISSTNEIMNWSTVVDTIGVSLSSLSSSIESESLHDVHQSPWSKYHDCELDTSIDVLQSENTFNYDFREYEFNNSGSAVNQINEKQIFSFDEIQDTISYGLDSMLDKREPEIEDHHFVAYEDDRLSVKTGCWDISIEDESCLSSESTLLASSNDMDLKDTSTESAMSLIPPNLSLMETLHEQSTDVFDQQSKVTLEAMHESESCWKNNVILCDDQFASSVIDDKPLKICEEEQSPEMKIIGSVDDILIYRSELVNSAFGQLIFPMEKETKSENKDQNEFSSMDVPNFLYGRMTDLCELFSKLSTESLFFIFYYMEGSSAQYAAAKSLKKRSWRFHTKYMMWFQRHEQPKTIRDDCEQGTYIYFDFEKWVQKKKEGFTFEYRYLEDRDFM